MSGLLNSRMDELLAETRIASFAAGREDRTQEIVAAQAKEIATLKVAKDQP